ncbi:EVE domain-containing protein [Candidatus Uhrbacteria bacterium]|nr:EVE domain-containing protein [Candidatus Uhrbacteria bacterium]
MAYWLVKTNPEVFSWEMLKESGKTRWDGVRNYQARNNLREMKPGDLALMFHTDPEPGVVGVMKIVSEAYDDPTTSEGNWSVIDVEPLVEMTRPVSQDEIRNTPVLNILPIKSQPKLSVMPVSEEQWELILRIGKTTLN